jgi:hypothetical protein
VREKEELGMKEPHFRRIIPTQAGNSSIGMKLKSALLPVCVNLQGLKNGD